MSIQSNINQGLSLASLLISQSPMAEKAREKARQEQAISSTETRLAKAEEQENVALDTYLVKTEDPTVSDAALVEGEEYKAYEEAGERVLSIQEELMEMDPSPKRHKDILARRKENIGARERTKEAREKAQEKLREEQDRLAFSRRVMEGIYSTDPTFDPRYTGGKKK